MTEWPAFLLAYGFSALVGGVFVRLTARQMYISLSAGAEEEHEALVRLTSLVGFLERMLYTYLWTNRAGMLIGLWLLAKVIGRHARPDDSQQQQQGRKSPPIPARARFNISLVNSALSLIFGLGGAVILSSMRAGDYYGAAFRAAMLCLVGFGAWLWAWLSPRLTA